jgi:hypothetical protein
VPRPSWPWHYSFAPGALGLAAARQQHEHASLIFYQLLLAIASTIASSAILVRYLGSSCSFLADSTRSGHHGNGDLPTPPCPARSSPRR